MAAARNWAPKSLECARRAMKQLKEEDMLIQAAEKGGKGEGVRQPSACPRGARGKQGGAGLGARSTKGMESSHRQKVPRKSGFPRGGTDRHRGRARNRASLKLTDAPGAPCWQKTSRPRTTAQARAPPWLRCCKPTTGPRTLTAERYRFGPEPAVVNAAPMASPPWRIPRASHRVQKRKGRTRNGASQAPRGHRGDFTATKPG